MAGKRPPKIPVRFYQTAAGREPVPEWLRSLDREDRRAIGRDLALVQYGWPVGMPLVRSLGDGLWEVRSVVPSRKTARLIFCFAGSSIVVLHGFFKHTRKTQYEDLSLARQRMREVKS
jgi:phage-related protein